MFNIRRAIKPAYPFSEPSHVSTFYVDTKFKFSDLFLGMIHSKQGVLSVKKIHDYCFEISTGIAFNSSYVENQLNNIIGGILTMF